MTKRCVILNDGILLGNYVIQFELCTKYSIDLVLIWKLIRIMIMENICPN